MPPRRSLTSRVFFAVSSISASRERFSGSGSGSDDASGVLDVVELVSVEEDVVVVGRGHS
jgi:hypothetical protein